MTLNTMTLHPTLRITPMLLTIVLLMVTLMQLSTDLYIPSLPAITTAFGSTASTIQLTLSIYLLGFSGSHLFYGPISDRIGRRNPILVGVLVCAIGSLLCFMAPNAVILIIGRFIQGVGIGCCNSVGRSVARDLLSDRFLAKIGSQIGMVSVLFLALSPTLGGYIQEFLGWRANFLLLFVFTCIVWGLAYHYLPETNQHPNPKATQLRAMLHHYGLLFRNPIFMGYTLCSCFAGAGLIAYLTIAPFLFQTILKLTPAQFGWLACFVAAAIFISGYVNSRLIMRVGVSTMVYTGTLLMFLGSLFMLFVALIHPLTILGMMLPLAVFSMGAGLIFINGFAGAFHPFPKMAGTTGALFGCLQDLSAGAGSLLIALLHINDQFLLACVLMLFSMLSLLAWHVLIRHSSH